MIKYKNGNLLKADVEALVNAVNTVGVMGKGIALQFKLAFLDNFIAYQKAAKRHEIIPGKIFLFDTGHNHPHYTLNFPTKRHWRDKSRMDDITNGLDNLVQVINENNIHSIAIPPLGCGYGGLDWEKVHPTILAALKRMPKVDTLVYLPY